VATAKKPASSAKPRAAATSKARSAPRATPVTNGIPPIRGKRRRELIEALIERTTKDQGFSPEMEAHFKDDAWGKRLVP
jgi:hypothetical protein